MQKFRIGTDDFKKLRDNSGYFVDKSLFIKEIIDGDDVTLIPRPRRFGKTLNMSMIRYFFEKTDESSAYLFDDLAIVKYPEYMKHQGQYPVIYISLKDVKGASWQESRKRLSEKIGELTLMFHYISPVVHPIYNSGYNAILTGTADDATLKASLKNLIGWLYEFHQKPVIVLIDEYDSPMIEAWTHGYYEEMAEFMRSWLGGGLKHENAPALYRAVVTGILRVAKESIFSELNNLKVSTTLLPSNFSHMFGFTEEEIEKILVDFNLPEIGPTVREWYNGYSFGTRTIYNPWSVTYFINKYPAPPAPHWLNTSSNKLVYEELEAGGLEIKQDLLHLLSGEEVRYPIIETITFRDIGKDPVNIWSFLYFSGYLRAQNPQWADYDRTLLTYALTIPNLEIMTAYRQFVNHMYGTGNHSSGIKKFLSVFIENKPPLHLEEAMQDLVLSLVSMYDIAKIPEAVFHAFVLGLLANLRSVYEILQNPESGYGRADILMIPNTRQYPIGYVIEFKSLALKGDREKAANTALIQMREKGYETALQSAGIIPERIMRLAIVLQGKKIIVREDDPSV